MAEPRRQAASIKKAARFVAGRLLFFAAVHVAPSALLACARKRSRHALR
jgi:hypothetical protein